MEGDALRPNKCQAMLTPRRRHRLRVPVWGRTGPLMILHLATRGRTDLLMILHATREW